MTKTRKWVDRKLVRQLEDQVQSTLGENYGLRKAIEQIRAVIDENKHHVIKLQMKIEEEKKGTPRGIPVDK